MAIVVLLTLHYTYCYAEFFSALILSARPGTGPHVHVTATGPRAGLHDRVKGHNRLCTDGQSNRRCPLLLAAGCRIASHRSAPINNKT